MSWLITRFRVWYEQNTLFTDLFVSYWSAIFSFRVGNREEFLLPGVMGLCNTNFFWEFFLRISVLYF
jgi:hypothetical protein